MIRSLEEQAAEMKARRLAQGARKRPVRKNLHEELITRMCHRLPYLNKVGFANELRRLWGLQTKFHQRRLLFVAKDFLKNMNPISVVPDMWMTTYLDDGTIELNIFEVVVSHDIDLKKAFFYNELSEIGMLCNPPIHVWVSRVDKLGMCIRYDPEHLYFEIGRLYS